MVIEMSDLPKGAMTPAKIAERQLRFRIPLYQRPYAWEEQQVRQLLEDLHAAFMDNSNQDYHIGILSVAETSDGVYDLIDGQQRMTTLALFGKAAKKHWLTDRLDLYGRSDDKAYLTGKATVNCNPNSRMMQTVDIAEDFLKLNPGLDEFIYNHAAVFLSEIPIGYTALDKNRQFVRFNNRGRQLEKHEILKVQVISHLEDPDPEWQVAAFSTWDTMTTRILGVTSSSTAPLKNLGEILGESRKERGDVQEEGSIEFLYRAILGVEEFLLIALSRTLGAFVSESEFKFYNKSLLLETFKKSIKNDNVRKRFIEVLGKQVEHLRKYFIFIGNGDEKFVVGIPDDVKETDWLEDEIGADGKRSVERQLVDIQSYLYVSTAPHKWLIPAFDWIDKQQGRISAGAFAAELERIDQEDCGRPSLQALEEMRFDNIYHHWFYRLDYELMKLWRKEKGGEVWKNIADSGNDAVIKKVDEFRFRRCGSVEHIMPQHQMESNATADHTFRNLAFISASRNSKFSNEVMAGKEQIILQSGYTESLKMLHALWGGQTQDQHGKTMYDILANAVNQPQPTTAPNMIMSDV